MARRVAWTNNSSGHLGTHVYRAESLDPQSLPEPVATVGPVAQGATAEWIDNEELAGGDYDHAVQDFDDQGLGAVSAVAKHTVTVNFSTLQAGDEAGGGYFIGIMLSPADDSEYALIVSPRDGGDPDEVLNYQNAINYCESLSLSGVDDWVLPTIDELRILYRELKPETTNNDTDYGATDRVDPPLGNYSANDPSKTALISFQEGGLESLGTATYWSSSEAPESDSYMVLTFIQGNEGGLYYTNTRSVRAVRRVPV